LSIELGGKGATTLRVTEGDCASKTKNDEMAILKDVIRSPQGHIKLVGHKFLDKSDFFDCPCESSLLGIFKVSSLDRTRSTWDLSDYDCKLAILPCVQERKSCVAVPVLHTFI